MKKLFTLFCLLPLLCFGATRDQFATTNTGPVLTNIILSMVVAPTNGTTPTQVSNIVSQNAILKQSGFGNVPTITNLLGFGGSFTGTLTNRTDNTNGHYISIVYPQTNDGSGTVLRFEWETRSANGTNIETVYNIGWNVNAAGLVDTNHFGWQETIEMNWDPFYPSLGQLNQVEQYWTFYPRSNGIPVRIYGNTMRDNFLLSGFATDTFTLSDKTSNVPKVTFTLDSAGAGMALLGTIAVGTNGSGTGYISIDGPTQWKVPTGVTASSVYALVDYGNAFGLGAGDFAFLSTGSAKAMVASGFTNFTMAKTLMGFAGTGFFTNGLVATGGTISGNASGTTNAAVLIAGSNVTITTNTAGRVWTIASSGGGGGFTTPFDTNQFSTVNGTTNIPPFAIVTNMVNVFTNTGAFNFIARDTTPSGTTVFFGSDLSRNAWGIIGDLLYISGATVISNDAHITGSLDIDQNLNVDGDGVIDGNLSVGGNITIAGTDGTYVAGLYSTNSITNAVLTATRVLFAGPQKQITDDAGMTYNSGTDTLTLVGGVTADHFTGDGSAITGVTADTVAIEGVISSTNGWGSQVVNFATPEATTNAAAAITFTGIVGWDPAKLRYEHTILYVIASGADRLITPAAGWYVNGVPGAPTFYATNGQITTIHCAAQIGLFTNLSISHN